jgi:hypothetical protein
MKLGIVVRDDNGGLGNLTYDVFRHLKPAVTVVVQSRPCRGTPRPIVFEEAWTSTISIGNPISDDVWEFLAPRADVWWTAETWYNNKAEQIIAQAGKKSVLYAMPELFSGSTATKVWNPTDYLHGRLPKGSEVVPWPTDPAPKAKIRTSVKRILHISGGAQYDRNGTALFIEALRNVSSPVEVMFHQPDETNQTVNLLQEKFPSNIKMRQNTEYMDSMKVLFDWADMVVLPRRYAGLCLPAFEAFGHGCLVMMPEVDPQAGWPIIGVPAIKERPRLMKGGKVPMWTVDPKILARRIESVIDAPIQPIVRASEEGRAWAETRSWERLLPVWKTAFDNV